MTEEQVKALLKKDPEIPKVICMNDGSKYRIKHREQWLAGGSLVLLQNRELVFLSYRNIASINEARGKGRGRRQRTA